MAASASEARRFSLAALAAWGLSALDETVTLLVTELAARENGVRHAGTRLDLVLSFDGRCLRIAVADGNPHLPDTKARRGLPMGGWGLKLVDALSTEWARISMPEAKLCGSRSMPRRSSPRRRHTAKEAGPAGDSDIAQNVTMLRADPAAQVHSEPRLALSVCLGLSVVVHERVENLRGQVAGSPSSPARLAAGGEIMRLALGDKRGR